MTEAKAPAASPWQADRIDRTLALINYGLLFASIFFAGIPGLIAVVIAYAQRPEAPARVKSHLNYQIRIFWIAAGLTIVASGAGLVGFGLMFFEMLETGAGQDWRDVLNDMAHTFASSDLLSAHPTPVVMLFAVAFLGSLITLLWLAAAPAVGFIRLVTDRSIGEGPR
jgi:uncharacterized membrane protein